MNKLIRAASMLSLGTASLVLPQFANAAEGGDKAWKLTGVVKAFYDDNIFTAPSNAKLDSYGFEVNPQAAYKILSDAGEINFGYSYSAKYFDGRPKGTEKWDQAHMLTASANREINPTLKLALDDSFAIAQEPEQLQSGLALRAKGNNQSNHGGVKGTVQLPAMTSAVLGYRNDYFNYEDPVFQPRLNRIEHTATLDLHYQVKPETDAFIGYAYRVVGYNSGQNLFGITPASIRDNNSHVLTVGADHQLNKDLTATVIVGAQIVDYENKARKTETSPYADARLSYVFLPGSSVVLGLKNQHAATDVFQPTLGSATDLVEDSENTTSYLAFSHAITPLVTGKVNLQYQNSKFIGGLVNGKTESLFTAGFTLTYKINENLNVDAIYNYDKLTSQTVLARDFSRNRVSLGLRATF